MLVLRVALCRAAQSDGSIDVWDLVDQTNKPSLTKSVVSVPITCMGFRDPTIAKAQQFLAAGDSKGNLHVLDIPASLRKPGHSEHVSDAASQSRVSFLSRVARVECVVCSAQLAVRFYSSLLSSETAHLARGDRACAADAHVVVPRPRDGACRLLQRPHVGACRGARAEARGRRRR
jgi:hypothetical protein